MSNSREITLKSPPFTLSTQSVRLERMPRGKRKMLACLEPSLTFMYGEIEIVVEFIGSNRGGEHYRPRTKGKRRNIHDDTTTRRNDSLEPRSIKGVSGVVISLNQGKHYANVRDKTGCPMKWQRRCERQKKKLRKRALHVQIVRIRGAACSANQ